MPQSIPQESKSARLLPALLLLATAAASLVLTNLSPIDTASNMTITAAMPDLNLRLADASQARMTRLDAPTVYDHYGNPAAFVKYIIRRPPTLA